MPPPRPKAAMAAQSAPKGTKKTFDDDDDDEDFQLDFQAESSTSRSRAQASTMSDEDDEDESDDDMPEAVGMSAGKDQALRDLRAAQELEQSKRAVQRQRQQKIAAIKAKETSASSSSAANGKRRRSMVEDEEEEQDEGDEETRRLRARMERAMDAGEGDSEDDSLQADSDADEDESSDEEEGEEEEDLDSLDEDDSDGQSFHTDSDEQSDEENKADEIDDSDSEVLEEGPIDAATRAMRDRMQAAMEAAERRAGIVHPAKTVKKSGASKESQDGDGKSSKAGKRIVEANVVDEDSLWDLGVGTGDGGPQPLSAEALRRGEEEDREMKRRRKEKEEREEEKKKAAGVKVDKKRKRIKKDEPIKRVGGKTVHILQATLDPSLPGLPPALEAGSKLRGQAAGQASKKRFVKNAMKSSGLIPGKNRVDGRRKPMGLEARS